MPVEPFTLVRGLEFTGEPVFLTGSLLALVLYGIGVWRLRGRGDRWPVARTVSFTLGIATVLLAMCTALNDYGMVMFSVHMVQHTPSRSSSPASTRCTSPRCSTSSWAAGPGISR
jgi:putative membrane protein